MIVYDICLFIQDNHYDCIEHLWYLCLIDYVFITKVTLAWKMDYKYIVNKLM